MNDENTSDRPDGESTRRSVLKRGALATAAAGLAGVTSGGAAAQESDGTPGDDRNLMSAIISAALYRPNARFFITSPVLDWSPKVPEVQDNVWSDYNTRVLRYLNTDQEAMFYQAHEAQIPQFDQEAGYVVDAEGDTGPNGAPQPEIFRMHPGFGLLGDSRYMAIRFSSVPEEEEDDWLDNDDWWYAGKDEDAVGPDDVPGSDGNATGGN